MLRRGRAVLSVADTDAGSAGAGCALLPIGSSAGSLDTGSMADRRIRGEAAARAELHRRAARTEGIDARREDARRKRSRRRPPDPLHLHRSPESRPSTRGSVLERFLDALDRERLAPLDVLLLLRVAASEATLVELAAALDREVITIRRTAGDLIGRGLLRQRSAPRGPVLDIMPTGLLALGRLAQPLDLSPQAEL
jgi:hypothetical protein